MFVGWAFFLRLKQTFMWLIFFVAAIELSLFSKDWSQIFEDSHLNLGLIFAWSHYLTNVFNI